MDTISRENNSYLPIAGVAVGVLALALSVGALVSVNKLSKKVPEGLADSVAKIDVIESEARSATSAAEKANSTINSLGRQTNDAFAAAAAQIGEVRGEVEKIKEASKAKAPAAGKAPKGPVVAGEGEYVIKGGDYGSKIAKAHGCTLADLQAVNPGVNLAKVQVGQKIKLPKK
ncbi:MAG: LysM peptidoglycan-binding domain-containing protein [Verrucomicrobia bacterium]|nr:LysM peptidoglycan-binding domain-containing protein [Verrucomicrobiota bacterium]